MQQEDKTTEEMIDAAVKRALAAAKAQTRQQERGKVLYNTRILMESYREMRRHVETAISEVEELDVTEFEPLKTERAHLESVRRTKLRTALMIANIDRAMDELEAEQSEIGMSYKYEAFKMHYIDGKTFEDIAEALNCGKNTPARWSKDMMRRMSVKLFGVDGVEKAW